MTLLDHQGRPISSDFTKAPPPRRGEVFGNWAGRDQEYARLPGGSMLQFDLSRLTLSDFRTMRDHYQVNASLSVLSFMMHQLDWHIECEDKKLADETERQLREIWTPLIRAMGQAYWAGFSPNVLQWENNVPNKSVDLAKVKDLIPEECVVNWKTVEGYAPPDHAKPKLKVFNGIRQRGMPDIPVENSLWYPFLMENGDYYGKKMLRPAFPSWFFSMLIHLFANRYYERYGEPLPVGRAPFNDDLPVLNDDGTTSNISGREAMIGILTNLRNRGIVVLPADRSQVGGLNSRAEYDYDIEYLESQMRGADFERYLDRLDEEISLSLFTPLLVLKTADVGSYNLGVGHMQMYLFMLNALAGDLKVYLDRYVVRRIATYNSPAGLNAPPCKWIPRKLGKNEAELLRAVVAELIRSGTAKPNLDELGQAIGLELSEVRQVAQPPTKPGAPDETSADTAARDRSNRKPKGTDTTSGTTKKITARIGPQIAAAWEKGTFGTNDFRPALGFRKQFENALMVDGADHLTAVRLAQDFYGNVERWMTEAIGLGKKGFSSPDEFNGMLEKVIGHEVEALAA